MFLTFRGNKVLKGRFGEVSALQVYLSFNPVLFAYISFPSYSHFLCKQFVLQIEICCARLFKLNLLQLSTIKFCVYTLRTQSIVNKLSLTVTYFLLPAGFHSFTNHNSKSDLFEEEGKKI